jgi:LemA protein
LRTEVLKPYNPENPKAVQEHFAAADQLFRKMSDFGIHCEAYPDLKSSETMVTAMQTYNETEGQLSASRRFYNSAAARLNTSIEIFPGSLLSSLIGVQSMPSFQAENKAKDSIDVHDFLK